MEREQQASHHALKEFHMGTKDKSEKKWAVFFEWPEGPMQKFRQFGAKQ